MTAPEKPGAAARRALLEQRIQVAAQRAAESAAGGDSAPSAPVASESAAAPADTIREMPLAVAQRSIWWFAQLAPGEPVYNEVALITRRGPIDVAALQGALADVVARHEAWRTTFAIHHGEPVQIIHPAVDVALPVLDLSRLPAAEAVAAAVTRAAEHARLPYDLSKPPLLRALLIKVSPDEHRLYLALHHLIFDGVSLYRVALPELIARYAERTGGPSADLAPPTPYSDFVAWERAELARPPAARHLEFHRRRLADAPLLDLPLDRPRPPRPAYRGGIEGIDVPAPIADRLRSVASGCSATLFQVLAAAYAVVLGRFSGQDDVVFGTATDLRRRRELYSVVGLCVSSSVLRVRLDEDQPFTDLVTRVRDELADLIDHPVPFDELVRELQPERDPRMHPLFQAGFVFEPPAPSTDPGWNLALMEVDLGNAMQVAKFDLHLEFDERPTGELAGRLVFNTDLFDRETARRIMRAILLVLDQVVADPTRPVADLAVIPEPDLRRMLTDWNATSAAAADDCTLTMRLESQASRSLDAVAVRFAGSQVTYRELHESANALAEKLVQAGAGAGTLVGLGSERSIEMIVGLLAILKTGAAYLPLDPALPRARLRYMVADARLPLLLLDDSLIESVAELAAHSVRTVALAGCLRRRATRPPATAGQPGADDPAYVLYTSGSTGTPKAVVVPHRAVVSMLDAYPETPGFAPGSRFLSLATISFDIAAAEIWLPLVSGERVVLSSRADATDPRRLASLIRDEGVTSMQGTPSLFQMLLDADWGGAPNLTVLCGGEHMSEALAARLAVRCLLWNGYGPTETTVYATAERIHGAGRITIGRPIQNTRAYILDRRDRPVPIGVTGELHIAGGRVATGYLHRPELTAARFVPEYGRSEQRMYRTGDLARYLPDGRIELFGRTDQQIKIRGHRVELGEIESAVIELSGADSAAVVLREDTPGDSRLVAYLVAAAGEVAVSAAELRRRLASVLPTYMVPSAFVSLAELPQTATGKLDRLALPAPASDVFAEKPDFAAELTPFEQRMAAVWARVLGTGSVGPDDDFFAVGGHSLLAVRLVAEIETEFAIPMSVSTLIEGDVTVRGLASRLSPREAASRPAVRTASVGTEFVRFNAGGDRPPLVIFFPSRESFLAMRLLQAGFDPAQPLIGVLAGLDENARFPRESSILQIAEEAVATVRGLQPPNTPYRIAGYSMAGLIAYEVAGLLVAEGEEVEWLGLVDTYSPSQAAREFSIAVYLERSRGRSLRKSVASAAARVRTESIVRYTDAAAKVRRRQLDRFDELGARRLMGEYTPSGHKVPLDLFVTHASSERAAPMLGWSQLHPGAVQIREIGGDHMSIMQGDAARRLADALVRAQP